MTARPTMRARFAEYNRPLATGPGDNRMRGRIELLSEVVFEVDANGLIVFMSSASITMLGRHPGVCLHLPLPDLVVAEDRSAVERLLRRETPLPRKLHARMPRADGSHAWVLISLTPIDTGGAVGVLHDITAEKQDADELAHLRDQVAAAADAKSAFIANVSHEIRTPLAAIIGLSHLCLGTKLTDKQRDYLTKTEQAAQDLFQIVNDILDFSKIEAGGLKLEAIPFALRSVFANVDALMRPRARAKGLELQIERGESLPAVLNGDPLRLEQIIVNLVSNAIKFTARGSVCVSALVKAQDASGVLLEFGVSDTGIGLQPEQTSMIFQAFSQADNSTTRQFGGTGLGLAISKRLVEKKGGSIWVNSTPGIGSTFYFTARYARADGQPSPVVPVEAASFPASARQRLRNARILVVEDSRFNQQIVTEFLEAVGVKVTMADNGSRALQILGSEPRFDAVLMDVQMPVMDGYETTRRIRSNPDLRGIPVIAITANTLAGDRIACLKAGMNDFEAKPIDQERLYATIARWLPRGAADPGPAGMSDTARAPGASIDRSVLARLVNFDPVKVRRFALKFVESSRATLAEMLASNKRADLIALGRLAHRLKSAAATVGAESFATRCKDLETACQNNDAALSAQIVAELEPALERVNAELLADSPA
ncbi:MAG: ATP-binding protein [Steroidobacterales bacterium]